MLIKRDKWLQYRILRHGASLAERLPETQLLKKEHFNEDAASVSKRRTETSHWELRKGYPVH